MSMNFFFSYTATPVASTQSLPVHQIGLLRVVFYF